MSKRREEMRELNCYIVKLLLGQRARVATFFSRSSKSLRSTFDLCLRKSSRMRSSCLSITGRSSRYGRNSASKLRFKRDRRKVARVKKAV